MRPRTTGSRLRSPVAVVRIAARPCQPAAVIYHRVRQKFRQPRHGLKIRPLAAGKTRQGNPSSNERISILRVATNCLTARLQGARRHDAVQTKARARFVHEMPRCRGGNQRTLAPCRTVYRGAPSLAAAAPTTTARKCHATHHARPHLARHPAGSGPVWPQGGTLPRVVRPATPDDARRVEANPTRCSAPVRASAQ